MAIVEAIPLVVDDSIQIISYMLYFVVAGDVLEGDFMIEVDILCDFAILRESFKADDEDGTVLVQAHQLVCNCVFLAR